MPSGLEARMAQLEEVAELRRRRVVATALAPFEELRSRSYYLITLYGAQRIAANECTPSDWKELAEMLWYREYKRLADFAGTYYRKERREGQMTLDRPAFDLFATIGSYRPMDAPDPCFELELRRRAASHPGPMPSEDFARRRWCDQTIVWWHSNAWVFHLDLDPDLASFRALIERKQQRVVDMCRKHRMKFEADDWPAPTELQSGTSSQTPTGAK